MGSNGNRKIDPELFRRLYAAGVKLSVIRRRFGGVSLTQLKKMRQALGIPPRTGPNGGRPKLQSLNRGDIVKIVTPDNGRLNGTLAEVEKVESWGCHLLAPAAHFGHFRALWSEMEYVGKRVVNPPPNGPPRPYPKGIAVNEKAVEIAQNFSGNVCWKCFSAQMVWDGKCQRCLNCGETSGGCS